MQDDWKVSPKLTVNLGMRYEFETPLHERYNRSTLGFDTTYTQPISAAAQAAYASIYPNISGGFPQLPPSAFALRGGMTFAGLNGNDGGLYNTPKDVFMPRVGLAYQLDDRTVLRSGFGMFAGFLGQRRGDVQQNGFSQNTNMVLTNDNGLHWLTTLANPFPNGVAEPQGAAAGLQTYLGQGFTFFNQNPKVPVTMRWEAQPAAADQGLRLRGSYVGSKTNHIEITRNINALPQQYLSTLPTRDDTWNNYLSADDREPDVQPGPGQLAGHLYQHDHLAADAAFAVSRPSGRTPSTRRRTPATPGITACRSALRSGSRKGYTLSASYTFAKWMQAVNLLNASDPAPLREISDSDAPHRINVSGVWALPFGKGRKLLSGANGVVDRIVGGWEVSGIWSMQSGFALPWGNVIYYGNPADIQLPLDQRTPEHWFNVANFETASAKQLLGNQVRTWPFRFSTIRGPRQNNVDLALLEADPDQRREEHRVPRRGAERGESSASSRIRT